MNQGIKLKNKNQNENKFQYFLEELEKVPFITIIGKYDHILGPKAIFSSIELKEEHFIRDLLRDALNTKNKFVILNFSEFYAQIFKIEIQDDSARGGKQLYSIILIRHMDSPLIPEIHFKRLEMLFRRIGRKKILLDEGDIFKKFYKEIKKIYLNKDEIVPLESCNIQIRSGVNTIQGFCELILEQKKKEGKLNDNEIINYIKLMHDACNDIISTIEENFQGILK
ncbi:MAG: hypothetical protein P8Y70_16735 [Candidatus Lokiarchaeota archaeon]